MRSALVAAAVSLITCTACTVTPIFPSLDATVSGSTITFGEGEADIANAPPGFAKVVFVSVPLGVGFPPRPHFVIDRGVSSKNWVNVSIDGASCCQLGPGRYAQLVVPYGVRKIRLAWNDIFPFEVERELSIDRPLMHVWVRPTFTSYRLDVIDKPLSPFHSPYYELRQYKPPTR